MSCGALMEFVFISRLKVWEELKKMGEKAADVGQLGQEPSTGWLTANAAMSRGSSILSAHLHILAAVVSQRTECFSEHVRLLLAVNLRRLKGMVTGHVRQLWSAAQNGPSSAGELQAQLVKWLGEATELLDADLRTMRTVLKDWREPTAEEARFYSHESDGRFSTLESLRRDTFDEWEMDKGLLRGLLRHTLPLDAVVADFGAGSGHYASWLNDTGLVTAYAFDGTPDIELVTKGAVSAANLGMPFTLERKFDWVLCIEVAEQVPPQLAPTMLQNLDLHAEQGVVLSWARPGAVGIGHANPMGESEVLSLVGQHTGLLFNQAMTGQLRASSLFPHLRETLFVFVRSLPA